MIFQSFPIQSMGMQIGPCCKKVKGHSKIIILTNLLDHESPMLYTKLS